MRTEKKPVVVRSGAEELFLHDAERTQIVWHMSYVCNYHCSYCLSYRARSQNIHHSVEKLVGAASRLGRMEGDIDINLFGLEASIHPGFVPVVKELSRNINENSTLQSTSNGSNPLSFFKEIYKLWPDFTWTVSVHFEETDTQELIEKFKFMSTHFPRLFITIMFQPEYRNEVRAFFEKMCRLREEYPLHFSIALLRSKETDFEEIDSRYTEDDLAWALESDSIVKSIVPAKRPSKLKKMRKPKTTLFIESIKNGKEIVHEKLEFKKALTSGMLQFKNYYCYGCGKCIINIDGSIVTHPCFRHEPNAQNIFDDTADLDIVHTENRLRRCVKPVCSCSPHMVFPKFVLPEHAPRYLLER